MMLMPTFPQCQYVGKSEGTRGQGGMDGPSSVRMPQQNGTSSPQSNGNNAVSWNMMSAAASSSDYYQMPSTLQGDAASLGGGAASQGGGVTSLGGGMPVMDSFSDGDLDSPLPPLDDLVSSPTMSDPYGSGGERKEEWFYGFRLCLVSCRWWEWLRGFRLRLFHRSWFHFVHFEWEWLRRLGICLHHLLHSE